MIVWMSMNVFLKESKLYTNDNNSNVNHTFLVGLKYVFSSNENAFTHSFQFFIIWYFVINIKNKRNCRYFFSYLGYICILLATSNKFEKNLKSQVIRFYVENNVHRFIVLNWERYVYNFYVFQYQGGIFLTWKLLIYKSFIEIIIGGIL